MAALRLAILLVATGLLALPSAQAAAADGHVETGRIALGSATVDSLGLTLLHAGDAPPELTLEVTNVAIQRYGARTTTIPPFVSHKLVDVDERASFARATLTLVASGQPGLLVAKAQGPASLDLEGATVRPLAGALLAEPQDFGDPRCHDDVPDCFDVLGAYELVADDTRALLGGELRLLLRGPTLRVVDDAGETHEYPSGSTESTVQGAPSREDTWVLVRASAVTGSVSGPGVATYATAPTLRAPAVSLLDAVGTIRVGAVAHRANGDDVAATGALVLTPGPVVPAADHGQEGAPTYAATFTTRVAGDIRTIDLSGTLTFLDSPAQQATALALAAVLLGTIAYAWHHLAFALAALYTRLNKPDILENDVRMHIYEIIRTNPGISAREVHRRSNQSWGTVVYHLRQLERHHLVVSRALGRTRNYYENHGKYKGMEAQLACLQSERARVLARAIAAQPGITQEQLAQVSGFPQPTTSYYVRKLKQAGLCDEQRDGRYVKYVPHADLPRFIELSERSVQSGGASGSGVQA